MNVPNRAQIDAYVAAEKRKKERERQQQVMARIIAGRGAPAAAPVRRAPAPVRQKRTPSTIETEARKESPAPTGRRRPFAPVTQSGGGGVSSAEVRGAIRGERLRRESGVRGQDFVAEHGVSDPFSVDRTDPKQRRAADLRRELLTRERDEAFQTGQLTDIRESGEFLFGQNAARFLRGEERLDAMGGLELASLIPGIGVVGRTGAFGVRALRGIKGGEEVASAVRAASPTLKETAPATRAAARALKIPEASSKIGRGLSRPGIRAADFLGKGRSANAPAGEKPIPGMKLFNPDRRVSVVADSTRQLESQLNTPKARAVFEGSHGRRFGRKKGLRQPDQDAIAIAHTGVLPAELIEQSTKRAAELAEAGDTAGAERITAEIERIKEATPLLKETPNGPVPKDARARDQFNLEVEATNRFEDQKVAAGIIVQDQAENRLIKQRAFLTGRDVDEVAQSVAAGEERLGTFVSQQLPDELAKDLLGIADAADSRVSGTMLGKEATQEYKGFLDRSGYILGAETSAERIARNGVNTARMIASHNAARTLAELGGSEVRRSATDIPVYMGAHANDDAVAGMLETMNAIKAGAPDQTGRELLEADMRVAAMAADNILSPSPLSMGLGDSPIPIHKLEDFVDHAGNTVKVGQAMKDVRYIPQDIVARGLGGKHTIPGFSRELERFKKTKGLVDEINAATRLAVLYTKPSYVTMNLLGNTTLSMLHQGPLSPVRLAEATFAHRTMKRETAHMLDVLAGEGKTLAGFGGRRGGLAEQLTDNKWAQKASFARGSNVAADAMGTMVDRMPRRAAVIHEIKRYLKESGRIPKGTRVTGKNIDDFIENATANELDNISHKAKRAMVDFDSMSQFEREVVSRIIFFYPWLKGSTRLTKDLVLDHPLISAGIGYVGNEWYQQSNESLGPRRDFQQKKGTGFPSIGAPSFLPGVPDVESPALEFEDTYIPEIDRTLPTAFDPSQLAPFPSQAAEIGFDLKNAYRDDDPFGSLTGRFGPTATQIFEGATGTDLFSGRSVESRRQFRPHRTEGVFEGNAWLPVVGGILERALVDPALESGTSRFINTLTEDQESRQSRQEATSTPQTRLQDALQFGFGSLGPRGFNREVEQQSLERDKTERGVGMDQSERVVAKKTRQREMFEILARNNAVADAFGEDGELIPELNEALELDQSWREAEADYREENDLSGSESIPKRDRLEFLLDEARVAGRSDEEIRQVEEAAIGASDRDLETFGNRIIQKWLGGEVRANAAKALRERGVEFTWGDGVDPNDLARLKEQEE